MGRRLRVFGFRLESFVQWHSVGVWRCGVRGGKHTKAKPTLSHRTAPRHFQALTSDVVYLVIDIVSVFLQQVKTTGWLHLRFSGVEHNLEYWNMYHLTDL